MTFQDAFLLQKELGNLQANAEVRRLLGLVAQDAQDETIDLQKSAETVVVQLPMNLATKMALFEIRAFLQALYCWLQPFNLNQSWKSRTDTKDSCLFSLFLFENHTRIQKLLVVAKLLDHVNLQSFGTADKPVNPMPSDIPTYARLWGIILDFKNLGCLDWQKRVNRYELSEMPVDYKFLCPPGDKEAFFKRGAEE